MDQVLLLVVLGLDSLLLVVVHSGALAVLLLLKALSIGVVSTGTAILCAQPASQSVDPSSRVADGGDDDDDDDEESRRRALAEAHKFRPRSPAHACRRAHARKASGH